MIADCGNYLVATVHWWVYNMEKEKNKKEGEKKRKRKERIEGIQTNLC